MFVIKHMCVCVWVFSIPQDSSSLFICVSSLWLSSIIWAFYSHLRPNFSNFSLSPPPPHLQKKLKRNFCAGIWWACVSRRMVVVGPPNIILARSHLKTQPQYHISHSLRLLSILISLSLPKLNIYFSLELTCNLLFWTCLFSLLFQVFFCFLVFF